MEYQVRIKKVSTVYELPGYWTEADYRALLAEFDYADADTADPGELRELLDMAINDFEPHEAAEVVLRYKLRDKLTAGQIQHLSHEMAEENESEEYPDIALHYPLFAINQLLRQAYNGVFPNAKATRIELELTGPGKENTAVTKEVVLKALAAGLSDKNLIHRLFAAQLTGQALFADAAGIIWELTNPAPGQYTLLTSDYWINREDIVAETFTGQVRPFTGKKSAD